MIMLMIELLILFLTVKRLEVSTTITTYSCLYIIFVGSVVVVRSYYLCTYLPTISLRIGRIGRLG